VKTENVEKPLHWLFEISSSMTVSRVHCHAVVFLIQIIGPTAAQDLMPLLSAWSQQLKAKCINACLAITAIWVDAVNNTPNSIKRSTSSMVRLNCTTQAWTMSPHAVKLKRCEEMSGLG
jgi:hypothetical protein